MAEEAAPAAAAPGGDGVPVQDPGAANGIGDKDREATVAGGETNGEGDENRGEGEDKDKSGGKGDRKRDRSSRSRSRSRRRDRKERSRSRDRRRSRSRDRRRSRSRSRDRRDRDRRRRRSRSRSRDRRRSRSRSRSRDRSAEREKAEKARRLAALAAKPKPPPPAPHPGLDPNFTAMIAKARQAAADSGASSGTNVTQEDGSAADAAAQIPPGTNPLVALQIQLQLAQQKAALAGGAAGAKQRQVARRLYIGNLPIGTPGIEAILADFCNQAMIGAGLASPNIPGNPIMDIWLSAQQTFGFIEFRSDEECTNGLNLNGVQFQGRTLRVARPADYVDPNAPIPNISAGLLGMVPGLAQTAPKEPEPPTVVLALENMVTLADLEDPQAVVEINEDTVEECSKCGAVAKCIIPVPRPGQPPSPLDEHVGKIFVEFKDLGGSARAKDLLQGRKFDGKQVVANYFKTEDFKVLKDAADPAAAAAAAAAKAAAEAAVAAALGHVPATSSDPAPATAAAAGDAYNPAADVEGFPDPE